MKPEAATTITTNTSTTTTNINLKKNNDKHSEVSGGLTLNEFLGRQAAFKAKVQEKG